MAKISLRDYIREIDQMINRGFVNEAIAHCKYILRLYPKHIDTYRLLGNAFLESQRYTEASDILGRVLSVIPDDFIAHVGMSIIREDEKNLDDAIWHMEKAYEVQPFNKPVQDELRRLIGQRDGVTPSKVRLTRGALVRMYAKGDLFEQAISEARAAIKEDPNRIDLQVLLARLLKNNGQKLEAIETSKFVLNKLPYCLEANQILADSLSGTTRNEDARIFAQRAASIDPYTAYCDSKYTTSTRVPAEFVSLEQLEYTAGQESEKTPEWTQSVGINWTPPVEDTPNWITDISPTENKPAVSDAQHVQPFITSEQSLPNQPPAIIQEAEVKETSEAIPMWMQAAGWTSKKEDPATMDQPFKKDEELLSSSSEISPADIPDWLKDLAPEEPLQPDLTISNKNENEDLLSALSASLTLGDSKKLFEPIDEQPTEIIESSSLVSDQSPIDTFIEGAESQTAPIQANLPSETEEQQFITLPKSNTGDISSITTSIDEENEIPDWIKDLSTEVDLTTIERDLNLSQPEPIADQPVSTTMPDWIKTLESSDTTNIGEIAATAVDENEALAWLESLAIQQGVDQATLITKPEERTDTPPSWIRELSQESPQASLSESEGIAETVHENTTIASPLWLDTLAENQGKDQETQVTTPEDHLIQTPDWIIQETEPVDRPIHQEAIIEETPSLSTEQKTIEDMNSDEALAWLESLAERHGAEPETLITLPQQRRDEPPAWVLEETIQQVPDREDQEVIPETRLPAEEIVASIPFVEDEPIFSTQISSVQHEDDKQGTESGDALPTWMKELLAEDEQLIPLQQPESPIETNLAEEIAELDYPALLSSDLDQTQLVPEIQPAEWITEVSNASQPENIELIPPAISQIEEQIETKVEALSPVDEEIPPSLLPYPKVHEELQKGKVEEINDSISEYIQKGEHIDEIIHDLRDGLVRSPINLSLWQLLGDAYFKNNQLQEALDSYTKAEELLR